MTRPNAQKPLSPSAWSALASIAARPQPRQEFNPGVTAKLASLDLIVVERRESPYPSHKPGTRIEFAVVNENGIAALEEHRNGTGR